MAGALEVHSLEIQLYDAVDPAPDGRYNVERRVVDMSHVRLQHRDEGVAPTINMHPYS